MNLTMKELLKSVDISQTFIKQLSSGTLYDFMARFCGTFYVNIVKSVVE